MLVDCERVLLEVKRYIATKPHHGQRELSAVINSLEAEHSIEEGLPERTLRLYGLEFFEEAIRASRDQPTSPGGRVPPADGNQARASRGDSIPQSEEDDHARSRNSDTSARGAGASRRRSADRGSRLAAV